MSPIEFSQDKTLYDRHIFNNVLPYAIITLVAMVVFWFTSNDLGTGFQLILMLVPVVVFGVQCIRTVYPLVKRRGAKIEISDAQIVERINDVTVAIPFESVRSATLVRNSGVLDRLSVTGDEQRISIKYYKNLPDILHAIEARLPETVQVGEIADPTSQILRFLLVPFTVMGVTAFLSYSLLDLPLRPALANGQILGMATFFLLRPSKMAQRMLSNVPDKTGKRQKRWAQFKIVEVVFGWGLLAIFAFVIYRALV